MFSRSQTILSWFVSAVFSCGPFVGEPLADEIKRRADAPRPLPPAESVKRFRLPDDLRIELAAGEPLLSDPSSVAWDEEGRMFVGEIHGYNLEGHLDVEKLNKMGQLDQVVRRIPASDQAKQAAEKETYGTVKRLVDTDGDGRMDRAEVWADRLPPCFGIVAARGGIIAVGRPEIIFLADRDNDGRAEIRETLFSGFEITILERSINNPRWGLDNWIYVSAGQAGGEITGPQLQQSVSLGATDFRFKPDGSVIEPVTGRNTMFGQTMTDWGDRFVTPPGQYAIPIPQRYLTRNPYLPAPGVNAGAAHYNRLYPASQPHPWRVERSEQKEWSQYYTDRYGASESSPNGFFTSACGQMIYRADLLPEKYRGNHFCCDPAQNLVHRSLLSRDGLRFTARRAPEEQQSEFLTSTDQWFRPMNLASGPDGAIYIVDMYREIIEDYSAIPRYLQQQYGLIEGNDRGRIWRVLPKTAPSHDVPNLAAASTAELVAELGHSNAWRRLTAQRLLVERDDRSAVTTLEDLARHGNTPQARLHAIYTLAGLQSLKPALVEQAFADSHYAVRVHALRLCEPWLERRPSLLDAALKCVSDSDAKVRLQAALTLGASNDSRVLDAFTQLAARDGSDEWFRAAILSSALDSADRLLTLLLQKAANSTTEYKGEQLVQPLASTIGARHDNEEIGQLLHAITSGEAAQRPTLQALCLTGLLEGLERGSTNELASETAKQALGQLLGNSSAEVRSLALRIAGVTKFTESAEMQRMLNDAADSALDEMLSIESRRAAIDMLASAADDRLPHIAEQLLDARQPISLQLASVAALAPRDDPQVTSILLNNFSSLTPKVQQAAIDAVFSRADRLPQLLDAVANNTIPPQSLSTLERTQLLESSHEQIRARAKQLFADQLLGPDPKLLEEYRDALARPRDEAHGAVVFNKICASCHRINQQEPLVGPDLSVVQTRSDETVLLDVLQPSAKITSGYQSYVVIDASGRTYSGVLESETATSVTLRAAPLTDEASNTTVSPEHTILRKDIEEIRTSDQSLMPDNLVKELSPQDLADVIAFLRKSLGPPAPPLIVLFEDEEAFIAALTQGSGTAVRETNDKYSGAAAVRITPPQRHSPQMPGWQFAIREKPGPGEFRYLRLAWKISDGDGVMIELADNARWPSAELPLRRYYAGKNTTDWQATQVSDQAPAEWVVVTRDLWKDFGDFTLTGIAPTAMGGAALFDRIELLRSLDDLP